MSTRSTFAQRRERGTYLAIQAVITVGGKPSPSAPVYVTMGDDGRLQLVIEGWWGGWGERPLGCAASWEGCDTFCVYGNYGEAVMCTNMLDLVAAALATGGAL